MVYNVDYLVASLIFMLLILFHHKGQNKLDTLNNRFFMVVLTLAMSDVFLDLISTILISISFPLTVLMKIILTVLYMLQVLMPYVLFLYTRSLRLGSLKIKELTATIWSVPPVLLELFVLINYFTGIFFSYTNETYIRGPWYLYLYFYALIYSLLIAADSIIHYRALGFRKFSVIWEFILAEFICVAVQARFHDILMTGFGLTIGITILFLTINNPHEYTDSLTNTLNSQYFLDWSWEQINHRKAFHIIAVDLYQLRRINTIYGIKTGNHLLVRIAEKLLEMNSSQNVFRITGKRFLVALSSLSEYENVRNNIQKYFCAGFETEKGHILLPAIICGIMDADKLGSSDDILSYTEYLLSLAPDTQDPFLIQSSSGTLKSFRQQKAVEIFLPTAIEEDFFEIYYQPVFSPEENGYVTLEALSRLRHPKLGPVSPDLFISLAEKNGSIAQLGYLQFRKICRFIKENPELMTKIHNVKINLSPAELLKKDHCSLLIDTIHGYGLKPSFFQFEITETVATEYCDSLYQTISIFTDAGVGLCLDDFGSGYANLNTVLKLPFTDIKLDRSLLNGIFDNTNVEVFYRNIVIALKNMGFHVIAEGIETQKEMELVTKWGVDMIQGFYYSKPLSCEKILELFNSL